MHRRETVALIGLAAILTITVTWWALALWPLESDAPAWIATAQSVCFGTGANGLPDAAGWMALILQPAIMFGVLGFIAGDAVIDALAALFRLRPGRLAMGAVVMGLILGFGATVERVATAPTLESPTSEAAVPETYPRLDRDPPRMELIDQHGRLVTLDAFIGRPVLLTFGFAHCETVCPMVVSDVLKASYRVADLNPVTLVMTLDPWRDTPRRLSAIARQWGLDGDAFVLGGAVPDVEGALDAWNVARSRDLLTGDITHPRLVYIIDSAGRVAYATTGGVETIVELVGRL